MTFPITKGLIAAYLALVPIGASALPCDNCRAPQAQAEPTQQLVAELSAWVAEELGLDAPVPPPPIRFVPRARLPEIAEELSGHAAAGREFLALYLIPTQEILLSTGWDPTSHRDRSVLVHELVHHADAVTGWESACPGEREKRAYEAQSVFLAETGDTLEAAFQVDRFTLLVLTACGY